MNILLEILLIILAVDFASGLLHWLEDSYGNPEWPITGKWITQPNMLHHQKPAAFTGNSWLHSAMGLLVAGAIALTIALYTGNLTWQLLLFITIGVNANEIHKWSHLPRRKRSLLVNICQYVGLLQTQKHHTNHHRGSNDTHYCIVTNLLNPVLDNIRFWRGLEWLIKHSLSATKRA